MSEIQGIVLAGGISSRMGFPKALLPFGNSFFLHRIYETLVAAESVPIHLVINAGLHASLKKQAKQFPLGHFVLNGEPARGQIYSLQLGLAAAKEAGARGAIVALVDQPAIRVTTVTKLCESSQAKPGRILIASYEGKHGHPILIPADFFDAFLQASPDQTARDIIQELSEVVEVIETSDPQVTADVDSPEDLARLRELETDID